MKTGIDIELDEPNIIFIYKALNQVILKYGIEFCNQEIENILIDKEINNEFVNSNGIGTTEYVLKIRFK